MSNLLITFSHETQGLFQDDNGLPKSSPDIWDILFGIFIRKESSTRKQMLNPYTQESLSG